VKFIVTGVNNRSLHLAKREKFYLLPEKRSEILTRLARFDSVSELVVLSTCNRTELYAVVSSSDTFHDLQKELSQALDVDTQVISQHGYSFEGEEALRHLMRVCSSLDSMVLGETQVYRQVKEAFEFSFQTEKTGPLLNQLFHHAFSTAKRVRTETGIGAGSTSISSTAVDFLELNVCLRTPPRLLILGAGEVAADAAKSFAKRNLGTFVVVNRDEAKAHTLADELGGEAKALEHLEDELAKAHALLTCCHTHHPIITPSHILNALNTSDRGTLTIIDLGVPRNVDEEVRNIPGVNLYHLDDLTEIAEKNRKTRESESSQAEFIVREEAKKGSELLDSQIEPTIAGLIQKYEGLRQKELSKVFTRMPHLSESDRELIDACTTSIVTKILHDPIITLKEKDDLLLSFRQMFRLDVNKCDL